jgi:hypothetical protein
MGDLMPEIQTAAHPEIAPEKQISRLDNSSDTLPARPSALKDNTTIAVRGPSKYTEADLRLLVTAVCNLLEQQIPELKEALNRPDSKLLILDDVNTVGRMLGIRFPESMDGVSITPASLQNGTPVSRGNYIALELSAFVKPGASTEYTYCKLLALMAHEAFHLQQPHNPPAGTAIRDVPPVNELEKEAYSKEIKVLEHIQELFSKTKPAYAAAMAQVIEEEKQYLAELKN